MKKIAPFLFLAVALAIGNFIWQAFNGRQWSVAIERSWFQFVACLAAAFINR